MNNDLISRSVAINLLNEAQVEFDEYYKGLGKAKTIIDNAPTVEAYTSEDIVKYVSATEDLVREKLIRSIPDDISEVTDYSAYPVSEPEKPQGEYVKGFIDALDKAFSKFDANCTYSGDRVLQILEKLKEEANKGGAEE